MLLLNKGILNYNAGGVPSVITDGNTVGWWIADDLTTITKNVSNVVSQWRDKLGGGINFSITGASAQGYTNSLSGSLWSSDGIAISYNSNNYSLQSNVFTTVTNLSWYVVMKITPVPSDSNYHFWIEGDNSARQILFANANLDHNYYILGAGSALLNTGIAMDATKYVIARIIYNGTSSYAKVDAATYGPFSLGALSTSHLFLGRYQGNNSFNANYTIKEFIFRRIGDTLVNETAIYNYLKAKYSL